MEPKEQNNIKELELNNDNEPSISVMILFYPINLLKIYGVGLGEK